MTNLNGILPAMLHYKRLSFRLWKGCPILSPLALQVLVFQSTIASSKINWRQRSFAIALLSGSIWDHIFLSKVISQFPEFTMMALWIRWILTRPRLASDFKIRGLIHLNIISLYPFYTLCFQFQNLDHFEVIINGFTNPEIKGEKKISYLVLLQIIESFKTNFMLPILNKN